MNGYLVQVLKADSQQQKVRMAKLCAGASHFVLL